MRIERRRALALAAELYERLLADSDGTSADHFHFGEVLERLGRHRVAIERYRTAQRMDDAAFPPAYRQATALGALVGSLTEDDRNLVELTSDAIAGLSDISVWRERFRLGRRDVFALDSILASAGFLLGARARRAGVRIQLGAGWDQIDGQALLTVATESDRKSLSVADRDDRFRAALVGVLRLPNVEGAPNGTRVTGFVGFQALRDGGAPPVTPCDPHWLVLYNVAAATAELSAWPLTDREAGREQLPDGVSAADLRGLAWSLFEAAVAQSGGALRASTCEADPSLAELVDQHQLSP